ncbi:uncharacterized protein LOC133784866 [Humulus lupulus]|uniref:uncharacterized protein LOC133784866 n=1 Tax=Humulus lupulus TaxID=3486 RepID=UPI002B40F7A8|nr:uncharacterized protein LOC133784866 [Humulus lupulus]
MYVLPADPPVMLYYRRRPAGNTNIHIRPPHLSPTPRFLSLILLDAPFPHLITTVIGFGMSATFIVFVCTRIICGRLRRNESRPMFEIESRIDLEQPEHQASGLEPVLVAAIPTMKFNHEAFSSIEDTH